MAELAELYAEEQQRVAALVLELADAELALTVPATPAWTVRDVVAHLTGIAVDINGGNITLGEPEWTQAQVDSRRGRDLVEVLEEWTIATKALLPQLAANRLIGAALVSDIAQHQHDIRHAVGRPGARDAGCVEAARKGYSIMLARRIAEAGLPGLELSGPGWTFTPKDTEIGGHVRMDPFEAMRSLGGRRSAAQVRAYDWDVDPEPYLPLWSNYGALRSTDLVE